MASGSGIWLWNLMWVAGGIALAQTCGAEVKSAGAGGFEIKSSALVSAPPSDAYARFLEIGKWWNPQHTYSGNNLRLEAEPGGCLCETLPEGGFVEHMRVVFLMPGKTIRLVGGLGPLLAIGATGVLSVTFESAGPATRVTFTYAVVGYQPGKGFADLAAPVDEVLSEQLQRLKRYAETGKS